MAGEEQKKKGKPKGGEEKVELPEVEDVAVDIRKGGEKAGLAKGGSGRAKRGGTVSRESFCRSRKFLSKQKVSVRAESFCWSGNFLSERKVSAKADSFFGKGTGSLTGAIFLF